MCIEKCKMVFTVLQTDRDTVLQSYVHECSQYRIEYHFGIKTRALFSKLLRDFNIHISSYPVSHHLWSAQTNNPYFKPPDEWSCQVSYFANKNVIYHNLQKFCLPCVISVKMFVPVYSVWCRVGKQYGVEYLNTKRKINRYISAST